MSNNWTKDIAEMHAKYGVNDAVRKLDGPTLKQFLKFRLDFLEEELEETTNAASLRRPNIPIDADEIVDGLIDLCVVAIGTLDALDIDSRAAWDRVLEANMNKEVGIKEGRPNPLGLPDLIKPEGWTAPTHKDNVGLLSKI